MSRAKVLAHFQQPHPLRKLITKRVPYNPHLKFYCKGTMQELHGHRIFLDNCKFECLTCSHEKEGGIEHGELYLCKCNTLYEVYGNSLGIGKYKSVDIF